jgi:hypothetical protein
LFAEPLERQSLPVAALPAPPERTPVADTTVARLVGLRSRKGVITNNIPGLENSKGLFTRIVCRNSVCKLGKTETNQKASGRG